MQVGLDRQMAVPWNLGTLKPWKSEMQSHKWQELPAHLPASAPLSSCHKRHYCQMGAERRAHDKLSFAQVQKWRNNFFSRRRKRILYYRHDFPLLTEISVPSPASLDAWLLHLLKDLDPGSEIPSCYRIRLLSSHMSVRAGDVDQYLSTTAHQCMCRLRR